MNGEVDGWIGGGMDGWLSSCSVLEANFDQFDRSIYTMFIEYLPCKAGSGDEISLRFHA